MRGRPAHRARQHGQAGYPSAHSRGLKGAGKGWRMPLEAHPQSLVCYHNCEVGICKQIAVFCEDLESCVGMHSGVRSSGG